MKRKWLGWVFCVLLAVCLPLSPSARAAGEEGGGLTFLFTTDVHSNILPARTMLDGAVRSVGGFARLSTAIDENYVPGETVLLDSGDFLIGTMFQNFYETDPLELRLFQRLGYDAVALGNHDFDYGEAGLRRCLTAFRDGGGTLPLLCSNLVSGDGGASPAREDNPLVGCGVYNYAVIEHGGVRVGVFSLMGRDAAGYTNTDEYSFADAVKTAGACVRQLREAEGADMVVLLSHCGTIPGTAWTEDEDLAAAVDGIDLILSGHSHEDLARPLNVNGTVIVCAGTALKYLGRLRMTPSGSGWALESCELIPLTEDVAEDAEISELVSGYYERLQTEYLGYYGVDVRGDEPFALSPANFPTGDDMCQRLDAYPFSQLLADACIYGVREAAGESVDLTAVTVGGVRQALYEGAVTTDEIYAVLGYGDSPTDGLSGSPVLRVYVTGREIYDAAETSVSLSSVVSAAQVFFGGVRYTYDEGRPFLNKVYLVEMQDADTGLWRDVARDGTLYSLACSLSTANLIDLVKSSSYGLCSVELKDERGALIPRDEFKNHIISYELPTGERRELKEWYALWAYIASMPENAGGLHVIPESYLESASYAVKTDAGLAVFFKNPSRTGVIMFSAAAILLALMVLVPCLVIRKKRRILQLVEERPRRSSAS